MLANAAKQLLAADQVAAASGARAGSSSSGLVLRNSLLQRRAFDGGRQLNSANSSEVCLWRRLYIWNATCHAQLHAFT